MWGFSPISSCLRVFTLAIFITESVSGIQLDSSSFLRRARSSFRCHSSTARLLSSLFRSHAVKSLFIMVLVPSFRVFGFARVLALVTEFDGGRRESFADSFHALVIRWQLFRSFHNRDSIVFTEGQFKFNLRTKTQSRVFLLPSSQDKHNYYPTAGTAGS